MTSLPQIKHILPHRHPMLLVDAVRAIDPGDRIRVIKNVTCNESCFGSLRDDAPDEAYAYPCSLIIESFCQAAGIMYNLLQPAQLPPDRLMLFGSIARFVFHDEVFPGETMEHRVRLERSLSDAAIFSGEVWVHDRRIACVERVVVALRPVGILANG